eukprot:tig00020553_g10780.t1
MLLMIPPAVIDRIPAVRDYMAAAEVHTTSSVLADTRAKTKSILEAASDAIIVCRPPRPAPPRPAPPRPAPPNAKKIHLERHGVLCRVPARLRLLIQNPSPRPAPRQILPRAHEGADGEAEFAAQRDLFAARKVRPAKPLSRPWSAIP